MKEGWKVVKLGDVCKIGIGRTPSRSDKSLWDDAKKTNNKWVSIADMTETLNGFIYETKEHISDKAANNIAVIPKGTILLSFKLTLGKTAIAGNDLYTNEAIANLPIITNEINKEYLLYYFQFFNWVNYAAGDEKVMGKTLNKKKLEILPVIYPPLPEQHRIVKKLDAEFEKIDAMKAKAEKNIENAKALFQQTLAEELEPKDGWVEKKITDLSENLDYKRVPITKNLREKGIYPYYGASGIVDYVSDYIYDENLLLVSEDGANLLARVTPIAFSVSGKVWVNNHAHVLRFEDLTMQKYVEYYFAGVNISPYVTGMAQPKLNQKSLDKIIIPYPKDKEIQQQIVTKLDNLSAKCKKLEEAERKTIAECDALKQAILRQAFNGEL